MEIKYEELLKTELKDVRTKLANIKANIENTKVLLDSQYKEYERLLSIETKLVKQYEAFEDYLNQRELGLSVNLESIISIEDMDKLMTVKPCYFDNTDTVLDFLHWFYEELPIILNKELSLVDLSTNTKINPLNYTREYLVINHINKQIGIYVDSIYYTFICKDYDLYQLTQIDSNYGKVDKEDISVV